MILDSRAVRALKLNAKFDERDYAAYSGEWHKAFEGHQPNILKAISKLPNFMKFTAASNVPKDELRSFIQEDWFVERVFDQYLWTVGKPVDKNAKAA